MIDPDAIDAIFFDLDGTLVDSDDAAAERLAARLNVARPLFPNRDPLPFARWLTMQAETPGNAFLTLIDALGLDNALHGVIGRLSRWRGRDHAPTFRPIEGVNQMLITLSGRYKLALVTSRGRQHIDAFCQAHPDLAAHLQCTIGRQDTRRIKPHPAPLRLAAEKLGVPVERCLMVGDTPVDIRAARRAGAWGVGVLCGFGQRGELGRAGAHFILGRTPELGEIL